MHHSRFRKDYRFDILENPFQSWSLLLLLFNVVCLFLLLLFVCLFVSVVVGTAVSALSLRLIVIEIESLHEAGVLHLAGAFLSPLG